MKQAEKSMETQKRVQDAAEQLFSEKGYDQTTMQDIIEKSGMSRGAIYHQYESKQEILQALTLRAQEKVREHFEFVKINPSLSPKEKILSIVDYLNRSTLQKSLIKSGWVEKVPFSLLDTLRYSLKEFAPLLADIIVQGVAQKEFRCDEPALTAEFILIFADVWLDPVIFRWTKEEACSRFDYLVNLLSRMAPGMIEAKEMELIRQAFLFDNKEENHNENTHG